MGLHLLSRSWHNRQQQSPKFQCYCPYAQPVHKSFLLNNSDNWISIHGHHDLFNYHLNFLIKSLGITFGHVTMGKLNRRLKVAAMSMTCRTTFLSVAPTTVEGNSPQNNFVHNAVGWEALC